ncbi:hypothetical protein ACX64P_07515 [Raoultella ornithinolytica]
MTDITELALITKIKNQLKNFDTVVLKEGEALALVEALEKAQTGEKQWREVVDAFCDDDADWHKLTNSTNELIALLSQSLCKQADRIAELESRTVTVKLPELNDDLIAILGRPNFMCAHLAELLRKSGKNIKRKSEHEQAAIIHWFLGIYLEHGDKWETVAKSDMQARVAGIKLEAE